jgi:hypothetical protein
LIVVIHEEEREIAAALHMSGRIVMLHSTNLTRRLQV